jgi:early secretory antigenic target protein ESAT-6
MATRDEIKGLPFMNNGMQQSAEHATRNGIQALEMANSGILRCRQDVEATRFNLSTAYKGSDGGAFGNLIKAWEEQADIILKNIEDMVTALNQTLAEKGVQQGSANDAINTAYGKSTQVFDTLTG